MYVLLLVKCRTDDHLK